ncbi:MAG: hypothetical protein NTY64_06645 [Deltaproteobacteria bacterium]|nr:hypothetical protein [Deltaproteobacteria bacterium]
MRRKHRRDILFHTLCAAFRKAQRGPEKKNFGGTIENPATTWEK